MVRTDLSVSYGLLLFSGQSYSFSARRQPTDVSVASGYRREVDDCALLGYYAASSRNLLPTFRKN